MRLSSGPIASRLATLGVTAAALLTAPLDAQVSVASANAADAPLFYGDVLPILQASCQSCHRPGEVAPMSLLTYSDARAWAREIRRMVASRRMPPWTADNSVGVRFHNDRALSEQQIATIVDWVDAGAPEGDRRLAPPPVEWVDGWQSEPDLILEIPAFEVPPDGTVEYTYYILPYTFEQDRWITSSEMRPTNRSVTHHLLAHVRPPGSSYFKDYPVGEFFVPESGDRAPVDGESAFQWRQAIGGYAPGLNPGEADYPSDQAVLVEAGSQVVFELHYTTNGEAGVDLPKLGLTFLDGEPTTRRLQSAVINRGFEIPPGADDYRVDASVTMAQDTRLLSLTPHMHLRGKAWEFRAVFPDGRTQVLLSTPRYDFNWQLTHFLAEPLDLPAGTVIEGTAYYDNSVNNPWNPDPDSAVRWGDQSWEEMMVGFFDIEIAPDANAESMFGRPMAEQ